MVLVDWLVGLGIGGGKSRAGGLACCGQTGGTQFNSCRNRRRGEGEEKAKGAVPGSGGFVVWRSIDHAKEKRGRLNYHVAFQLFSIITTIHRKKESYSYRYLLSLSFFIASRLYCRPVTTLSFFFPCRSFFYRLPTPDRGKYHFF